MKMDVKGKICILKKTYEGNTHDENWQNHIYVLDETPWLDKFEEICTTGYGWGFDPPLVERFADISECIDSWEIYDCDRNSWEVYTCEDQGDRLIRRIYGAHFDLVLPQNVKWYEAEGQITFQKNLFLKSEEVVEKG